MAPPSRGTFSGSTTPARKRQPSVSSGTFCQSGKGPGDIRSENADMSNDESCEKIACRQFQDFVFVATCTNND
jgi:hypothetical protein